MSGPTKDELKKALFDLVVATIRVDLARSLGDSETIKTSDMPSEQTRDLCMKVLREHRQALEVAAKLSGAYDLEPQAIMSGFDPQKIVEAMRTMSSAIERTEFGKHTGMMRHRARMLAETAGALEEFLE